MALMLLSFILILEPPAIFPAVRTCAKVGVGDATPVAPVAPVAPVFEANPSGPVGPVFPLGPIPAGAVAETANHFLQKHYL
jgi:hypothetical protein